MGVGKVVPQANRGFELPRRLLEISLQVVAAHPVAGAVDREAPARKPGPVVGQVSDLGIPAQGRHLVAQARQLREVGMVIGGHQPCLGGDQLLASRPGAGPRFDLDPVLAAARVQTCG